MYISTLLNVLLIVILLPEAMLVTSMAGHAGDVHGRPCW